MSTRWCRPDRLRGSLGRREYSSSRTRARRFPSGELSSEGEGEEVSVVREGKREAHLVVALLQEAPAEAGDTESEGDEVLDRRARLICHEHDLLYALSRKLLHRKVHLRILNLKDVREVHDESTEFED